MLARYQPDASEVVKLAVRAQHIERWKVPRAVRILAELPRTPNGKLARSELRRILATRPEEPEEVNA